MSGAVTGTVDCPRLCCQGRQSEGAPVKFTGCFNVKGLWPDSAAFDNHLLLLL